MFLDRVSGKNVLDICFQVHAINTKDGLQTLHRKGPTCGVFCNRTGACVGLSEKYDRDIMFGQLEFTRQALAVSPETHMDQMTSQAYS